ncbi:MAG: Trehalose synthase [Vampirovibrio sp.]|jgi:maltose alpha-D-glucosyltransferase/alpha-amylase|nr:Trehalose synthase [Vampirovibrio sp.]
MLSSHSSVLYVDPGKAVISARPKQPVLPQTVTSNPVTFGSLRDRLTLSSPYKLPKTLQKEIEEAATVLYGQKQAAEVTEKIAQIIRHARKNRPADLLNDDYTRPADWYKSEHAYMFYAERFGTQDGKPTTFKSLVPMLGYLKKLGVSTFYLLPFLQSPMIDAGFDVSDYKQVRKDLGGNEEFDAFLKESRKQGFKVKADLVLNHVSDQHPWFQAALKGDPEKLNYFLTRDEEPNPKVTHTLKEGIWADYREKDGSTTRRRIIFPDASSTHYRRETVQGKDKYFYYSFYPHQVDLNWHNPKVLYEALDVMAHWANKGIDIFRLDALPCYVKSPNSLGENEPGTHAALKLLSASLQAMSPRSVLWAEACQAPESIKPYFGKELKYSLNVPEQGPKLMNRTDKVQLAYHFPEMAALWAAMITKNPDMFWKTMQETPTLPPSAEWSSFLRVHDELSMEMYQDPKLQDAMRHALMTRGEPFREGHAVGGRLASFLDRNPDRIKQSNAILYSLPGMPLLYYGDEIGEPNSPQFMKQAAKEREAQAARSGAMAKSLQDARDTGRAPISRDRLMNAMNQPDSPEGKLFHHTQRMITLRKKEPALLKGSLGKVEANQPHIFSYLREHENQRILLAHNLSDEPSTVELTLPANIPARDLSQNGLKELYSNQAQTFTSNAGNNTIEVKLAPYESLCIKLPDAKSSTISERRSMLSGNLSDMFDAFWKKKTQKTTG